MLIPPWTRFLGTIFIWFGFPCGSNSLLFQYHILISVGLLITGKNWIWFVFQLWTPFLLICFSWDQIWVLLEKKLFIIILFWAWLIIRNWLTLFKFVPWDIFRQSLHKWIYLIRVTLWKIIIIFISTWCE